jgi:Fic family protein
MSHAMALKAGIGAHGLWSISRGLARGLGDAGEYKRMMDLADSQRRNDLDGRGNLSREALIELVTWFLRVALDQVQFMSTLFELETLSDRLSSYLRRSLSNGEAASAIVFEALRTGELPRGLVANITGRPERSARDILSNLIDLGLLRSDTPKGPVRLCFSSMVADDLFPRLFPAQAQAQA